MTTPAGETRPKPGLIGWTASLGIPAVACAAWLFFSLTSDPRLTSDAGRGALLALMAPSSPQAEQKVIEMMTAAAAPPPLDEVPKTG